MNTKRFVLGALAAIMACGALGIVAPAHAQEAAGQPRVLITGGNRGIGLAIVRQYAERGWNVVATARKPDEAKELKEIQAKHPALVIEALDVTDFAAIDALAAKYKDKPIDVLVNNAGISAPITAQIFGKLDYDAFRKVLETNTIGPMKLTEALMPSILAGQQKKVVTISSSEGSFGKLNAGRLYWYRASKAAVNMLMLNLAYNVKGKGVTVAAINPGPVDTDFMKGVKMPLQPPAESASKVIGIIDGLKVENTGKFWDYAGGELPW